MSGLRKWLPSQTWPPPDKLERKKRSPLSSLPRPLPIVICLWWIQAHTVCAGHLLYCVLYPAVLIIEETKAGEETGGGCCWVMRKLPKRNQASQKKKKKLSVGKRKPPKHTYTRLHTVLHSYQCPEPFESPLERWSPGKYPGPPNCDFSPFPPVVGYVQQHFQLLSDCLISIFLISEHQEY